MLETKRCFRILTTPLAMTLLLGLAGCVGGGGYVDDGTEWDGQVLVGGGGGYDRGHDGDYHNQAFHAEGGRPAAEGSGRGRASMGARGGGGGGGHASSGGGHR